MMHARSVKVWLAIAIAAVAMATVVPAFAAPAPFDLAGPVLDVRVTRGNVTLPAAEVPNLSAGDKIWIKADLPASQSAHYLLVAAFLRGATNPPPEKWFFQCKTWTHPCAADGLTVTVPPDAQQVLVFLAPQTGGDFKTLVSAVRGRPGAFVRTSQDLIQAALDRSRLERYLATIRKLNDANPSKIAEVTPLLARSLAIKVNEKCLDRLPELQAPCLMLGQESLILNDGHSTSIVEALTSGPGADLAMEASYTPQLSYGIYSPYIASVLDIARIFDSFATAQYQYIPALASQRGDKLALTLNAAPSFHNPLSVLVAALPAVETAQLPPLHAVDPTDIYCAQRTSLVLPVDGAPLVFSTNFAHDVALRLTEVDGKTVELPAVADPTQGGYVVDTSSLSSAQLGESVTGELHGLWGFDPYQGPSFRLMNARSRTWELASADASALIVGRQDTVHLRADSVSCIDGIMLKDPSGKMIKADWKSVKPNEVEIKLPLEEVAPGALTLLVKQYGLNEPQPVALQAFSEAGRFDGFSIHAGDVAGVLRGSRLDEVASLRIKDIEFEPGELSSQAGSDELSMLARDPQAAAVLKPLREGSKSHESAKVTLLDGRTLSVPALIEAPRPRVVLIGKHVQSVAANDSNIELAESSELPLDATLIFSVRSHSPATFSHDETIDVATGDDAVATSLSLANGGLALETAQVAVATLNPAKAFGPSTFGPLKFRINDKGVTGDWQPLATLVRLPTLQSLQCPANAEIACKLIGNNLYLIEAVAADAKFSHPVAVPDGFVGATLAAPHPRASHLYIRLRDDPQAINAVLLDPQAPPDAGTAPAVTAPSTPPAQTPTQPSAVTQTPATAPTPTPATAPTPTAAPIPAPTPAPTPAPPPSATPAPSP